MSLSFDIIPVGPSQIEEAGRVHALAWQDSHRGFCAPDFVALHTPERQARYLADKLSGGGKLFLLRLDGAAAGVVSVTGSLIEDLYVLPSLQNRGLGTALLRYAARQCSGTPTLWILENNARAERLYRREGFIPTGRRNAITDQLDEVEYRRDQRVQTIAPDEIDACAAVYAEAYAQPPWDEAYAPEQIAGYLRAFMGQDGFCAWRLSVGGAITGVALGIVVPCPDGPFLRLEDFCVAPRWQRQGLGGAFLAEIERLSAGLGCDSVLLATQPDVPAHRFYLKQGFREVPTAFMHKDV